MGTGHLRYKFAVPIGTKAAVTMADSAPSPFPWVRHPHPHAAPTAQKLKAWPSKPHRALNLTPPLLALHMARRTQHAPLCSVQLSFAFKGVGVLFTQQGPKHKTKHCVARPHTAKAIMAHTPRIHSRRQPAAQYRPGVRPLSNITAMETTPAISFRMPGQHFGPRMQAKLP